MLVRTVHSVNVDVKPQTQCECGREATHINDQGSSLLIARVLPQVGKVTHVPASLPEGWVF